jgi:hypothetical protein
MGKFSRAYKFFIVIAVALLGFHASVIAAVNEETVASVNGERIKGLELRESLGLWGGAISSSGIPLEKKKEALDRLIDGRLLEKAARSRKWDKTEDFSNRIKEGGERLLIPALFRMEIASKLKVDPEEIRG